MGDRPLIVEDDDRTRPYRSLLSSSPNAANSGMIGEPGSDPADVFLRIGPGLRPERTQRMHRGLQTGTQLAPICSVIALGRSGSRPEQNA
jgi:hypothetical protein